MMASKQTKSRGVITDAAAGAAANVAAERLATATDQVVADASILHTACSGKRNVDICRSQGTAFEHLEVLRFNRAAARAGSPYRAEATHARSPHDAIDIRVFDTRLSGPESTMLKVQCKSWAYADQSLRDLAAQKYDGMGRLATSDQTPEIKSRLRARLDDPYAPHHPGYEDVDANLLDTLEYDHVRSAGTTRTEAERTANAPAAAAIRAAMAEASREIAMAAVKGAAVGGAIGAGGSAINGLRSVDTAGADTTTMLMRAAKDGARSAARGGAVAGGGKAVSIAARRLNARGFAAGAGPAIVAAASVDLADAVRRYVKGDIDADELRELATGAILGAGMGMWCGMVGQILIPVPVVGALVGSTLGAFVATTLVDPGLFGSTVTSRAADDWLRDIQRAAAVATEAFLDFENAMKDELAAHEQKMTEHVAPALERLDTALASVNHTAADRELMKLGAAIGIDVPFHDTEDLRELAARPHARLVL